MIHQLNMYGKDMVEEAIEKIQGFSQIFKNDDGYFIAFSGGKDSVVIKALADMAGINMSMKKCITICSAIFARIAERRWR